jgi:uncharacterized protein (TIGR03086 family)
VTRPVVTATMRTGPVVSTGQLAAALRYAIGTVEPVMAEQLTAPTPCRMWDLRSLLLHACDSLSAMTEGLCAGRVRLDPPAPERAGAEPAGNPVGAFTRRAGLLLARCEEILAGPARAAGAAEVLIADCPLTADLLCTVGAIEIAVHGWDVSQACGACRPIPERLAAELLLAAAELICPDERVPQFALPCRVPATASASDRLAAFLGRQSSGPLANSA